MHFNPWLLIGRPVGFSHLEFDPTPEQPQEMDETFYRDTVAEMKAEFATRMILFPLFDRQIKDIKKIYEEIEAAEDDGRIQFIGGGKVLIDPEIWVKLDSANKYIETMRAHRGRQASRRAVARSINVDFDRDNN